MALRDLGANFIHWKTSEWEINSVASYKAIHFAKNDTDYSAKLDKKDVIEELVRLGISSDGKSPMTKEQISRKNEKWLRKVYNNFKATHNLGSIMNIHAEDLEIGGGEGDEYTTILCYSFP